MKKALEDIRVLACTHIHTGAYCSRLLAELGADVIRIEPPRGSLTRNPDGVYITYKSESFFDVHFNAQHRFVTLNLKHEKGKEMFFEMVKKSDVFVENYSFGAMDRMGVGYEAQKKVNPKIIYASIKTYGCTGPYKDYPGNDYLAQARSGLMSVTGWPDGPPTLCGIALVDHHAGILCALSILAALHHRNKTGEGQFIDTALFDAAVDLTCEQSEWYFVSGDPNIPVRHGNGGVWDENYRNTPKILYKTKDGYLALLGGLGWEKKMGWESIFRAIGREDLLKDPRYDTAEKVAVRGSEVHGIIEEWTKKRSKYEAFHTLTKAGTFCAPVQTIPEMYDNDTQVEARKLYVEVEHPTLGRIKVERSPLNLSETPGTVEWPGMPVGYHNEEVYGELLGCGREELAKLKEEGTI